MTVVSEQQVTMVLSGHDSGPAQQWSHPAVMSPLVVSTPRAARRLPTTYSSCGRATVYSVVTTVNPKGQVTIPGPLRVRYGFPPGTKVAWIEREGELIPRPVRTIDGLVGAVAPDPGRRSLADQLLRDRHAEREREDG
ncbi:MAG: AbrB/MazE/SpoVT family DNA-binding domain-containing protein [Candidatus Dormibacteria bacterium]